MNFQAYFAVKYYMKKYLPKIKTGICLALCIAIVIAAPCIAFAKKDGRAASSGGEIVLRIWQIDSFEGGKGSRADYLQSVGDKYLEKDGSYVSVTSISAEAARVNLANGNVPDAISYGAGVYGIEGYISGYKTWCRGGYCFLSVDASADFSDINSENTVINEGKVNLAKATALFCGVSGAKSEKSTGAYVSLINGKYKYLLGTQRDIFRLKTRGVSFAVKPVTEFNDLYQNISVTSSGERAKLANGFIEYLLSCSADLNKIGMFSVNSNGLYDDEMRQLEGVNFDYKLNFPISENTKKDIEKIVSDGDINKLKNLLK